VVIGQDVGEMERVAALGIGPGGVELGRPGVPQGASPRHGRASVVPSGGFEWSIPRSDGSEWPQQHAAPRQVRHLHSCAWDPEPDGRAGAARTVWARNKSAKAITSRNLPKLSRG
jgi:hypothetical protein